ncbi:MAG: SAM-dependent DNA methyltransferase [Bacteroidetes bacterium]|nr:SAM-dependent DNA methyltransferase [Bacteroidota bacterium]MCW5896779.1 SAM-dependent DNA methyltransferase [Bacteroidota bacterium]
MNTEIRRKLDRITDVLWAGGVTNPVTYIEQISYLIYLKLLDEEENSRELQGRLAGGNGRRLFPDQAERYRWSKWRFNSGEKLVKFVRDEVFNYMANSLLKDEPHIAEYFRDAVLEIVDPNVLKQVIDEIDGINFRKLGPDEKGDIFEYLLTHLGQSALNGQFRTPRQIRAMMVELVEPDFGDTVYDPACGTAGFLIDTLDYVLAKYSEKPVEVPIYGEEWMVDKYREKMGLKKNCPPNGRAGNGDDIELPPGFIEKLKQQIPKLQTYRKGNGDKVPNWELLEASLYGNDVSRQMMRIATMNMVLHGVPRANIKRANALSDLGGLSDEDLRRRYKVILSNPPFAGVLPKESIRKDLPTNSKKSELLFLGVMMEALAPGGRCAVVVPEGLLFGSTSAHVELRRKLIEEYNLLAIVSLPAGVFKPYAGVKTGVLVFRRPTTPSLPLLTKEGDGGRSNDQRKIWFYEIKNDGFDPDKISGGGRVETPELNDIPDLLRQWKTYKSSDFTAPPGVEAGTLLEAGTEEPKCWWATVERIAAEDYNLAAGRYKPQVAEKAPTDDPTQLICETIGVEQRITEALRKLLKDVE